MNLEVHNNRVFNTLGNVKELEIIMNLFQQLEKIGRAHV
jgi:hypothetical protein